MTHFWEQLLRRRQPFEPVVDCGTRGFVVHFARSVETVLWRDVVGIEAWKRDCVGIDVITLDLLLADGESAFVDEIMKGYEEFLNVASTQLPGFHRSAWYAQVAFPPFAENRTTIWKRPGPDALY